MVLRNEDFALVLGRRLAVTCEGGTLGYPLMRTITLHGIIPCICIFKRPTVRFSNRSVFVVDRRAYEGLIYLVKAVYLNERKDPK